MFSWTGCPFCKNAKALLDSKGAKYTAVELNTMDDGNAIRAQLAEVRSLGFLAASQPKLLLSSNGMIVCR